MSVTTVTGSNSYLIDELIKDRAKDYMKNYGEMSIDKLDAEELEADEVLNRIGTSSLFVRQKLVILKGLAKNTKLIEQIDALLASAGEETELIIIEPKLDKRGKLFNRLKSATAYKEIREMDQGSLSRWLIEEAKSRGGNIEREAAAQLIGRVGTNQEALSNELDKLLLYSAQITGESIDLLVERSLQSNTFDLIDAAFSHNHQKVKQIYGELRLMGEEPQKIIGLLAWQLHLLASIKAAQGISQTDMARRLGVKPGAISGNFRLSSSVSLSEIEQLVSRLLEIDIKTKQQAIDKDDALLYYLLSI